MQGIRQGSKDSIGKKTKRSYSSNSPSDLLGETDILNIKNINQCEKCFKGRTKTVIEEYNSGF